MVKNVFSLRTSPFYFSFLRTDSDCTLSRYHTTLPRYSEAFLTNIASCSNAYLHLSILMKTFDILLLICRSLMSCFSLFTFFVLSPHHWLLRFLSLASNISYVRAIFIRVHILASVHIFVHHTHCWSWILKSWNLIYSIVDSLYSSWVGATRSYAWHILDIWIKRTGWAIDTSVEIVLRIKVPSCFRNSVL
jgi:hypothetical protein